MSYYDKYTLNNNKIIQYLKKSRSTKKNVIFFVLFTKPQILTNISLPIVKVVETQIHQYTNIDKAYQCKSQNWWNTNSRNHHKKSRNHKKGGGLSQTEA